MSALSGSSLLAEGKVECLVEKTNAGTMRHRLWGDAPGTSRLPLRGPAVFTPPAFHFGSRLRGAFPSLAKRRGILGTRAPGEIELNCMLMPRFRMNGHATKRHTALDENTVGTKASALANYSRD
jgi:hypothetical protein